ncbi:hypothetical protein ACFVGN_39360 [Streptomyces sp. NPDC057757]|uniref:hypothetical protein n=1 Tax=Streptomyces sp. NPDC057757 TaxID=3346241 RepID=UPI0036C926BE
MPYMASKPFTDRVRYINACYHTYAEMAEMTGRSAAWWNNLTLGKSVGPPPPRLAPDMAYMLGVSERRIREMIAEEWYGIRPNDSAPRMGRRAVELSADLTMLDDADYEIVEKLTGRLAAPARDRLFKELDEQEQTEELGAPTSSTATSDETAIAIS